MILLVEQYDFMWLKDSRTGLNRWMVYELVPSIKQFLWYYGLNSFELLE